MPNGTASVDATPAEGQPRGGVSVWAFVPIGRDEWTLLDHDDAEWVQSKCWHRRRDGYFYRNLSHRTEGRGQVALHRELLGLVKGDGFEGDHINRDKLDNRRSNLRITDRTGNAQNTSRRSDNTTGYRGVTLRKDKWRDRQWRARAYVNGTETHVGNFATAEEANAAIVAFRLEHLPYATD